MLFMDLNTAATNDYFHYKLAFNCYFSGFNICVNTNTGILLKQKPIKLIWPRFNLLSTKLFVELPL